MLGATLCESLVALEHLQEQVEGIVEAARMPANGAADIVFAPRVGRLATKKAAKPGEVIKAEADSQRPFVKIVPSEGMPSHGNPFVKGDLYVLFRVEFPSDGELKPDQVEGLKKLLPGAAMAVDYDPETAEIAHLEHADVKNFGKGGVQSHDSAYDSDDDEGGPQQVQCQQS